MDAQTTFLAIAREQAAASYDIHDGRFSRAAYSAQSYCAAYVAAKKYEMCIRDSRESAAHRGIRLGGYGERRKRETGRPKQGGLFEQGVVEIEENILRVISPLAAEFVPDRWSGEDEIQDLDGRGMMPYREQIEQAAAEQAVDLLAYYDGPDEVREHLVSIIPSVAVQDGKLCGCTAITYRQDPVSYTHLRSLYRRGTVSAGAGCARIRPVPENRRTQAICPSSGGV